MDINLLPSYYDNSFMYKLDDYEYDFKVYVKYTTDLYDFDFICQIFEAQDLTDKTEYAYARKVSATSVNLIKQDEVVDTITVDAYDDSKYTPEEYVEDILETVCTELKDYNQPKPPQDDWVRHQLDTFNIDNGGYPYTKGIYIADIDTDNIYIEYEDGNSVGTLPAYTGYLYGNSEGTPINGLGPIIYQEEDTNTVKITGWTNITELNDYPYWFIGLSSVNPAFNFVDLSKATLKYKLKDI